MTFFIALAFLGILASLGTALFFMVRSKPENDDSPKASPHGQGACVSHRYLGGVVHRHFAVMEDGLDTSVRYPIDA
jgi:hypothetical protein